MIQQRDPRRGTRENDGANKEELTLFPGGIALEETLLLYPFFHNRAFYSIMHRMNERSAAKALIQSVFLPTKVTRLE